MKHCPNRKCPDYRELHKAAEYEDSAASCHRCGTALVDGPGPSDVVIERNLVRVYTSNDFYEAEVVKSALESAGLKVRAIPEELFSVLGAGLPQECAPELWVKADDADRARDVLKAAQETHRHKPWHCPHCGAKVGGDLVECWTCTRRRPRKAHKEAEQKADLPAEEKSPEPSGG